MWCPACRASIPAGLLTCPACGSAPVDPPAEPRTERPAIAALPEASCCGLCNAAILPGDTVCVGCGEPLA